MSALLVSVGGVSSAAAESRSFPKVRIGVVDFQRLARESSYGQKARAKLEREFQPKQEEMESLKAELQATAAQIQKQAALLSPSALEGKVEALKEKEKEAARQFEDLQESFSRRNSNLLAKLVREADKVVKQIANEKGLEFVLERDPTAVTYASENADITDEVIRKLDKVLS